MGKRLVAEHFKQDGRPKRSFNNRKDARKFLVKQGWSLQYEVYLCSFCHKYHLATLR